MLQSASELPSATTRGRGAVSAKSAGRPAGVAAGAAEQAFSRFCGRGSPRRLNQLNMETLQPLTAPPAGGVRPCMTPSTDSVAVPPPVKRANRK